MRDLYLIDASIYIFRAWFSLPDTITNENGEPVNAVYGFARFICEFLEQTAASHVAVAFDTSLSSSFRLKIYPDYKANREPAPPELKQQFVLCREFAEAAGLMCMASESFEADDLIATAASQMRKHGFRVVVVSGDKDLTQVLIKQDYLWDYARNRKFDLDGVLEKFGVRPNQMQDYLGLAGDSVDNIPGIPGVGPRAASALLHVHADLESIYNNLDTVSGLPIRGAKRLARLLEQHKDNAFLSRELATTATHAPIAANPTTMARQAADRSSLSEWVTKIGRGDGFCQRLIDMEG